MESTTTGAASSTPSASTLSSERVLEVLKASVDDAEALLREAAGATGDRAAELRERALKSLRATRETLHETQDIVLEQGRRAVGKIQKEIGAKMKAKEPATELLAAKVAAEAAERLRMYQKTARMAPAPRPSVSGLSS